MVNALNLLRNIGTFDNVSSGAQLRFDRLTLIYAENARGKTTLAAILRSLASGRSEFISERARLGVPHPPHVVIETKSGAPAVFQNGAWSRTAPEIVIFDDTFVADNVCSGMEVGTAHRQNLHELIVGAQGIALARELQTEVDRVEIHNRALRERENEIPVQLRGGLTVDAFCSLAKIDNLSRTIEGAERRLAAARESSKIADMPTFPAISLPKIDVDELNKLLGKGLPDLDISALARVQDHLNRLGHGAEAWAAEGIQFVDRLSRESQTDCPFCAQDLSGSILLTHYRAYFGEAYKALKQEITGAIRNFRTAQSGDVPAAFERTIRETVERQAFWRAFTEVPVVEIDTAAIARTWKAARVAVERLLEVKGAQPLEPSSVPADVRLAIAEHNSNCDRIFGLSEQLSRINPQLDLVKEQAREANVATLATDLNHLRAVKARYDPEIAPLCDAYLAEKAAKARTEQRRKDARIALDQHREAAFPAYGMAINDFLQRFNASFRVGPVNAVNTRGGSAANYTLLVDGNPVPLMAKPGEPSFRNTLSAGDRNTLALAFFFASLQNNPQRSQKVVVIDDPMTSLDEHRTLHTLQEIDRLARDVACMVVLSHWKPFLLGIWDKCQQVPKAALEVRRSGAGSTLAAWDVTAAMVTLHDQRYAAAAAYLQQADPAMQRRVAESLRPMLEAFCRVGYPVDFKPGSMLGVFHQECVRGWEPVKRS